MWDESHLKKLLLDSKGCDKKLWVKRNPAGNYLVTWMKLDSTRIGYSPYQLVNVGFLFTNHVCYVDPQKYWFLNACTVWWWFPFIRPAIKPLFLRDARGTCHLPVVRSWMPINASSQGGSRTVRAIVLQEGQGQFRQRWQKLQMGKCLDSSQVLG